MRQPFAVFACWTSAWTADGVVVENISSPLSWYGSSPAKFNPLYDSGDHLHPNDAGYKAMGEAIDLSLFK